MRTIPVLRSPRPALVSDEDYERLACRRWQLHPQGYAFTNGGGRRERRTIYMHREILGAPAGLEVDHADGDPLNNQRENLRLCTRSQNEANKPAYGGTSRYKGVCWDAGKRKWKAQVQIAGKRTHIGRYATEMEAARAYDAAARNEFGPFARANFPTQENAA